MREYVRGGSLSGTAIVSHELPVAVSTPEATDLSHCCGDRKIRPFSLARILLVSDMHTHRPLRYSRNTLLRSAFKPPQPCIRFTVEARDAVDHLLRGGDLFEAHLRADGSAAVLIADVSSKGALSVVHTEMMRRAFRMCATTERSPATMMSMLNRLRFDGPQSNGNVTFAAAIIVAMERGAMICRYASAGHDIVEDRRQRHLVPTGPVLGILPDAVYTDCLEPFGGDDLLVLATDGFTECRGNAQRADQFGTSGLAHAVAEAGTQSCITVMRAVARCADDFTGGDYRDDATLAVIARNDGYGSEP